MEMAEILEDQHPAHWTSQAWLRTSVMKPTSVLQTIVAREVNGGINRRGYDQRVLISHQIQLSRINAVAARRSEEDTSRNSTKLNLLALAGIKITNHPKLRSPHFVLSTTQKSGNVLGLLEHRFYWRFKGRDSCTIAVAEVQPGLNEPMKLVFYVGTKPGATVWQDAEDFYSMSKPVENAAELDYAHHTLFILPEIGNRLQVYNMNTGIMQEEHKFRNSIRMSHVDVNSSHREIIMGCQREIAPGGYMEEYLIAETIPFHVVQRLQIFGPFHPLGSKNGNLQSRDLDVEDGFLEIHDHASKQTLIYDLEKVIELNGLTKGKRSQGQVPTCQIKMLPPYPLFACPDQYYESSRFSIRYPGHRSPYTVVPLRGNRFEVHEISTAKTLPMDSTAINDFDEDPVVQFLKCMPLQIIAKGKSKIRIFQIEVSEDSGHVGCEGKSSSRLAFIFDRSYLNPTQAGNEPQPARERRSGLRQLPRKVYVDEEITLAYAENYFLNQLVVARFCERSIDCYIYDSRTLGLVTTVSPLHFNPANFPSRGDNGWENNVHVHFTNHFIAVEQTGKDDTNFYVINFLRGQE